MGNSIKERTIEFVRYKGIKMKVFEERCGLSSGYVTSMRQGFGSDKLNNVLRAFPELNRDWLLYGEGEMIIGSGSVVQSNQNGDNINGTHIEVSKTDSGKLVDVILQQSAQLTKSQEQLSKSQEQIDRLITIIEQIKK